MSVLAEADAGQASLWDWLEVLLLSSAGMLLLGVLFNCLSRPAPVRVAAVMQGLAVALAGISIALAGSCDGLPYTRACLRQGGLKLYFLLVDFFWFTIQCVEIAHALSEVHRATAGVQVGGAAVAGTRARAGSCCRPPAGNGFTANDCRRFVWYCLYGFGVPALICVWAISEQLSVQPNDSPFSPGPFCCWLYTSEPGWTYYHGPVALQLMLSWAALCSTPMLRARRACGERRATWVGVCPQPRAVLLFTVASGAWLYEVVCFSRGHGLALWAATGVAVFLRAVIISATLLCSPQMWLTLPMQLRRPFQRRAAFQVQVELEMEVTTARVPAPAPDPSRPAPASTSHPKPSPAPASGPPLAPLIPRRRPVPCPNPSCCPMSLRRITVPYTGAAPATGCPSAPANSPTDSPAKEPTLRYSMAPTVDLSTVYASAAPKGPGSDRGSPTYAPPPSPSSSPPHSEAPAEDYLRIGR